MLTITIRDEYWDERTNEFVYPEVCKLQMEHSLVSLSKWESKWHKPFFSKKDKTTEETLSYIKCMTLNENVDPAIYNLLTNENVEQINQYIYDSMTATTFPEDKRGKNNGEFVTAELIYYWMITLNIPVEFQNWHINRLLTLIRLCNIKNQPEKKMSKREIMSRNAALNAARRKQLNSRG
jgi:hypothetical protein